MPRKAKGYRYVEHTADVEFIASGRTRAGLIRNSLLAMFETNAYIGRLGRSKGKRRSITIDDVAPDLGTLLWYVLQDALSVADAEQLFVYKVSRISVGPKDSGLIARTTLTGKTREPQYSKLEVKGVSRYDMKVSKTARGYKASVVLDV